jgi:GNAT superfamily N-acetyltransferase
VTGSPSSTATSLRAPARVTEAVRKRYDAVALVKRIVSIRAIEQRDFENWNVLWNGYNAFYGRTGETALQSEVTSTTWRRFFDSSEPVYALVAECDGRLAGIAHFLLHRSTIHVSPVCYLADLFTAEDLRGSGVGRALIEGVYRRARELGCARVYWQTHHTNSTARRLYDGVADHRGFLVYRKDL